MKKNPLGLTEIEVSLIGLGTVKFGRNQGVKYPHSFSLPSDKEIANLISVASDLGINVLDTAPAYGASEERLGKLLKNKRHDWVIMTKAGEEFINETSQFNFSNEVIRNSVERSLKRLNTDYLDVLLIHSDGNDEEIIQKENIFHTLSELKKNGMIRSYGMSTKTIKGGLLTVELADLAMVSFNQNYLNEREVIAFAHRNKKGIVVKKALNSGYLSAKESLQFVANEPGVNSIIVGTLSAEHLRENVLSVEDVV